MLKQPPQKYGFEATFVLYKNNKEIREKIPTQIFYTKSDKKSEFLDELAELEKKLSEKYRGNVSHLIVTSLQDMPKTGIKKEDIVSYNFYALIY